MHTVFLYRHTKSRHLADCVDKINDDIQNLLLNAKKTKPLFSTQQMDMRHQFDFEIKSADSNTIERVKQFKLLGVTFNEDMK